MFKLSKKVINQKLVPHLSKGKRGPACKVGLWRIVRAILYRLKTRTQWRQLPIKSLFGRHSISSNHNDLFEVEKSVSKIVTTLSDARISFDVSIR